MTLFVSSAFAVEKITEDKIKQIFNKTELWEYATSELKEKNVVYSVSNLIDGDTSTCWATRMNGGVDESILFFFTPDPNYNDGLQKGINIINGFARKKELYEANNRVKDVELKLYRMIVDGVMNRVKYPRNLSLIDLNLIEQTNTILKDEYLSENEVYFNTDLKSDFMMNNKNGEALVFYALVLTVKSVYKGSKFNDLCISEISFLTNVDAGADGGATN
jgi:hypothetical protein